MTTRDWAPQWIEDLEYGNFQQTTGRLGEVGQDYTAFCCLGLLSHRVEHPDYFPDSCVYSWDEGNGVCENEVELPLHVRDALGMTEEEMQIFICLNDGEGQVNDIIGHSFPITRRLSFQEIAEVARTVYELRLLDRSPAFSMWRIAERAFVDAYEAEQVLEHLEYARRTQCSLAQVVRSNIEEMLEGGYELELGDVV